MALSDKALLRELYPTMRDFRLAIERAGGQKKLAKKLGIGTTATYDHVKWLKSGCPPIRDYGRDRYTCEYTMGELDKRVKELYGSGLSGVKVYQLSEVKS